jgi:hypothetical protein
LGNFIKVKSSSTELRVLAESAEGQPVIDIGMSEGTWVKQFDGQKSFQRVRVKNTSGAPVSVVLTIGYGEVDDSALTGTISQKTGTLLDSFATTVNNTAIELVPVSAARRSVLILNNDPTNDIYIGSDNTVTTANGMKVSPEQQIVLDKAPQAAVWVIGGAAGIDVRVLTESD